MAARQGLSSPIETSAKDHGNTDSTESQATGQLAEGNRSLGRVNSEGGIGKRTPKA
ncbi:MAG: hypothetical protein JRE27_06435 [Deltaproteobacteria bacterium]|nr:hypothetical protein [Deltaproteobacteria bacterium]